jgi:pimeloyl-ACP methyl ester carboxylesterase
VTNVGNYDSLTPGVTHPPASADNGRRLSSKTGLVMERKDDSVGLVLIHGAGLGAWIWDDVVARLDYPALAVDLPGRGQNERVSTQDLPLETYVDSVVADVVRFKPPHVVIVGHSLGGLIGLEAAHGLGSRVAGLVAVAAAIPELGDPFLSTLPFPKRLLLRALLPIAGAKPPERAIRKSLCNDLDEKTASRVVRRFVPESSKLFTTQTLSLPPPANSMYVFLDRDKEYGRDLQERMARNLGARRVAHVAGGHLAMLSQPEAVAKTLNAFTADVAASLLPPPRLPSRVQPRPRAGHRSRLTRRAAAGPIGRRHG